MSRFSSYRHESIPLNLGKYILNFVQIGTDSDIEPHIYVSPDFWF